MHGNGLVTKVRGERGSAKPLVRQTPPHSAGSCRLSSEIAVMVLYPLSVMM